MITIPFARTLYHHPFLRFAGVGFLNTLLDVLVLNVLTHLGVAVWAATAIGYACGWTNGFYLSSRFVFKQDHTAGRYFKYAVVCLGGLLLTELIVDVLHVRYFHVGLNTAKLAAVFLVFSWNYFLSKAWAFK